METKENDTEVLEEIVDKYNFNSASIFLRYITKSSRN
jgi:hypothetical protein